MKGPWFPVMVATVVAVNTFVLVIPVACIFVALCVKNVSSVLHARADLPCPPRRMSPSTFLLLAPASCHDEIIYATHSVSVCRPQVLPSAHTVAGGAAVGVAALIWYSR